MHPLRARRGNASPGQDQYTYMYKIFLRVQALKVEFEVENSRKIFLCFIHCSSPCTTAWKGRKKEREGQTSLVGQRLRTHLPVQGTLVRSLVQEDPTCLESTMPVHHNYRACAPKPTSCNHWAQELRRLTPTPRSVSTTRETTAVRAATHQTVVPTLHN